MAVTISLTADASQVTQETAKVRTNLSAAFADIQAQLKAMETASGHSSSAMVHSLDTITQATKATARATQVMAQDLTKSFKSVEQAQKGTTDGFALMQQGIRQTVALLATIGVSVSLAGLARDVVGIASTFETLDVRLRFLTNSLDEFNQAKQFILEFARTTPLQLDQVSDAFVRLTASGLDAAKTLPILVDAVSAFGGGNESLQRLIVNFQQMSTQAKVSGQELRDIARGSLVPAFQIVAEEARKMGITVGDSLAEASISGPKAIELFLKGAQERFKGATLIMATTWSTLVSNLIDQWKIFADTILRESRVFDFMKATASLLFKEIDTLIKQDKESMIAWGDAVVASMAKAAVSIGAVLDLLSGILQMGARVQAFFADLEKRGGEAMANLYNSVAAFFGLTADFTTQVQKDVQQATTATVDALTSGQFAQGAKQLFASLRSEMEQIRQTQEGIKGKRPTFEPPPAAVDTTGAKTVAARLKAEEEQLKASLKRQEQLIGESYDERRQLIDAQAADALAQDAMNVDEIARNRTQLLRAAAINEARDLEEIRLAAVDRQLVASQTAIKADIAAHAGKPAAIAKLEGELTTVVDEAEATRATIRAKRAEVEKQQSRKTVDDEIKAARDLVKLTTETEQDRLKSRQSLMDQETALVTAQVEGEVLTKEQGIAQIDTLQRQRLAATEELYRREAAAAIAAIDLEVRETALGQAQIAKIREDLNVKLQGLDIERQTQQQEHLNTLSQGWRDWVKDVRSALGDFLFRWMDGQVTSMKDVLNDLKSYFFRLIADMVAYAATKAIVIPIVTAVLGGFGGGVGNALGTAFGIPGLGNLLGAGGAAGGITGGGSSGGGLGALQGLGILASLKTIGSGFMDALGGLTDSLVNAVSSISQTFGGPAIYAPGFVGPVPAGGISTAAGTTGGAVLGAAGGLAALGAGIYGALNASNNAAKAAYAASAAAGAAAAVSAAAVAGLLGASAATAVGTGWTGIGLIVAAVMAVIGVVLDRVIKPAGPNLAVGQPGGVGVGVEGGQLVRRGDVTSRVIREEGVTSAQTGAVQQSLNAGLTAAVDSILKTINAVALNPEALLGPTQAALEKSLAEIQTINSASAKHMEKDIAEQLRFANLALIGGMLEPINMAFEQLVDSDLTTQLDRLPATTIGLTELFTQLNSQLDEMAKGENRDVLGQIQGTREAVERFGVRLAKTAGETAEQIVNGVIKEFDDAIERTQPLKLVSDFSHNLATLITTFNERMTDGLLALVNLQKTQKTLEDAGLSGVGVGAQAERLGAELAQQGEIFSTQIVTRALANLATELDTVVIQPIRVQATTVDSLFTDSLAALNSLWLEWHRLEDVGIDATRIQEQFTKLLGGVLDSSATLLRNALQKGTFPEFLDVLLSIPDALAKMNPVFERLKALGQAFAQVVGPVQQAISQGEDQLRTPADRLARTAEQMHDLEAAIADAGTSAEKALPLYAQLSAAIQANAAAQIASVQQVGAVIEQITAILDARLTTSQRLAQVNQQITDLQAPRPPIARISTVSPAAGRETIDVLSELVTLYRQQLDLIGQLIDAIDAGLHGIDETLRADETVSARAARLVQAATPRGDINRLAVEASPEALLRQAAALQDAVSAVREFVDVLKQGIAQIDEVLRANETVTQRAIRLVGDVVPLRTAGTAEEMITLAGALGDAIGAVRAFEDMIAQGLDSIRQTLQANETVTQRAVRLVSAMPSTAGVTDPSALLTIAGQIGEAIPAIRSVMDLLQSGIDSIDGTLLSLLSVAEQSARVQAQIAATGRSTPEDLNTLVQLTQQALSLQQQITQTLESTLQDLQDSIADTGPPANTIAETRSAIASLQTLAETGAATPEQLQQLVDLNQKLLGLGVQFDLLDVQQEALDSLKALAPMIQAQIDESKAREQLLVDSLVGIRAQLHASLDVAQTTSAQLIGTLIGIQTPLEGYLAQATTVDAQLVAELMSVQTWLQAALVTAQRTETQLIIQLTDVRAILAGMQLDARLAEAETLRLLEAQRQKLEEGLILQYGTANLDLIVKQIQEWQLDELRDLNRRLKDLFLQQPDAQALFGIQSSLDGQTPILTSQDIHLRNISDQTGTVINKLDEIFKQLERPLRTTPAQSGGFLYASLNRAATGPLGYATGGMVSAILEPGERVFPPPFSPAQRHALTSMNTSFPRMGGGWTVPGSGAGDHVPAMLPSGSFVLNRRASGQAGYQGGGVVSGSVSTNHITINIQVYQQPGQSARELVELLSKKLKREFRTMNDDSPFR